MRDNFQSKFIGKTEENLTPQIYNSSDVSSEDNNNPSSKNCVFCDSTKDVNKTEKQPDGGTTERRTTYSPY